MATWKIDSAHASAAFSARHMMITTVRGSFSGVEGTITFDPANPSAASVEATIPTTTINTGVEQRDGHLKSPDFLDVANFPTITFKSTKVVPNADGTTAKITGDLTIRGATHSVTLDAELLGIGKSMKGEDLAGFTARTKINREDWGLTWNVALETGGWLVGKDITIELDFEAIKVPETVTA